MKMPLNLLIHERFVRKDGTCLIYIQYSFNRKCRVLLNTGIEIPPAFWDKKPSIISQDIPKEYGLADDLNYELKKIVRIAEDIVMFAKKKEILDPAVFVKNAFKPDFDVSSLPEIENEIKKRDVLLNLNIYFQIDDYIQSKTKKVSQFMPRIYRNMKDDLLAFETFRNNPSHLIFLT